MGGNLRQILAVWTTTDQSVAGGVYSGSLAAGSILDYLDLDGTDLRASLITDAFLPLLR